MYVTVFTQFIVSFLLSPNHLFTYLLQGCHSGWKSSEIVATLLLTNSLTYLEQRDESDHGHNKRHGRDTQPEPRHIQRQRQHVHGQHHEENSDTPRRRETDETVAVSHPNEISSLQASRVPDGEIQGFVQVC